MRVGWLADPALYVGGAELTQAEFRAAAPVGVEVVDCPPGAVDQDCERYAVHNCLRYPAADLIQLGDRPVLKFWNDVGLWMPGDAFATLRGLPRLIEVCCSPAQAHVMDFAGTPPLIPPAADWRRFEAAAVSVNGRRSGSVCVASWRNPGKAPERVADWARDHGPVDFFGGGEFAPPGSRSVAHEHVPELLAQYERFVFLPTTLEPFGRLVVEAHYAGCELVINDLVGARWWLTEAPDRLESAATDFWELLLNA